jgi:hypothetical protein
MNNNGSSKNKPNHFIVNLDDPSPKDVAMLNSFLTSENPIVFMPSIATIDRAAALALLELAHNGKLSPSYQSYGYLLVLTLAGTPEKAVNLFANGCKFIKSTMDEDND